MRLRPIIVSAALLGGAIAPAVLAHPSVSPAGESIPANLLRIVMQLDAPLTQPIDLHRLRLLRQGVPIADAFLDLLLPSRDGRTITILLHPGRIKTGVGPNLQVGPALRAGDEVTFELDDPLVRKTWRVTEPQRHRIDVQHWKVTASPVGSREPLSVHPDAVLDGSATDLIAIADASGRRLTGEARMTADGSRWHFVPAAPWAAGRYLIRVHPALEDVAGNRQCAAFEQRDLSEVACEAEGRRGFTLKAPRR